MTEGTGSAVSKVWPSVLAPLPNWFISCAGLPSSSTVLPAHRLAFEFEKKYRGKSERVDYTVLIVGRDFLFEIKQFEQSTYPSRRVFPIASGTDRSVPKLTKRKRISKLFHSGVTRPFAIGLQIGVRRSRARSRA